VAGDECEGDAGVRGRGDGEILFCDGGGEKKGVTREVIFVGGEVVVCR
jgi:hypothetical protein